MSNSSENDEKILKARTQLVDANRVAWKAEKAITQAYEISADARRGVIEAERNLAETLA